MQLQSEVQIQGERHHKERLELLTALNHFQSKSDKAKTAPGFFKVEGEFNERVGKVNGLTKEHLLSLGN
jgi:hypothetical protein